MRKLISEAAIVVAAALTALAVPSVAGASPVTYTNDGQKVAKMGKAWALRDARQTAKAYIKAVEPYDVIDPATVRAKRINRQTVDVTVRYRSENEYESTNDAENAACKANEDSGGWWHYYNDVWITTWTMRYESWASWGNPYRVERRVLGSGKPTYRYTDPTRRDFGGKGLYMWIARTVDEGCMG